MEDPAKSEEKRAEIDRQIDERRFVLLPLDTTDPAKREKSISDEKLEEERAERKKYEKLVRVFKAAVGESDEIVKSSMLCGPVDELEEGGSSSVGLFSPSPNEQTVLLPQSYEENWRYDEYVQDMDGYDIRIDHFSEDEASEESGDDDDAKNTSAPSATLRSDVARLTERLSTTKVGQSSQPSPRTCILLPLHDTKGVYLLTFDGYHKKNRSQEENGGFGALLRCGDGNPVAAVAGGSKFWISPYFHTLEGVKSGLDLAISRDIKALYCVCNSQRVCETLRDCFINNDEGECPYHTTDQFDLVCRPCLQSRLKKEEPFDPVYEVVREIVQKGQRYYRSDEGLVEAHVKEWNKPADFLAKFERRPGVETELAPDEFPNDLMDVVYEHGGRNPFIYN